MNNYILSKKELNRLIKISKEKVLTVPTGISRKDRREWSKNNLNTKG